MIGALISLVQLIRRAAKPHVAFLGRIPGSRRFSDLERHPDNERLPGVLIFRPEASLVYFNAEHVRDEVLAALRAAPEPPKIVIGDLSASPLVDLAGAQMLAELAEELEASGARLQLVEARSAVRDLLRSEGVDAKVGGINRFKTVAESVDEAAC